MLTEKEWEYEGKKYVFTMPTIGQTTAADLEYSKAYTDAIKNGLMPRVILERDFKEKGIWSDSDNVDLDNILNKLQEQIMVLKTSLDQDERNAAKRTLEIVKIEYQELYNKRTVLFQHSADSKGEAARILELAYKCILDVNKNPVWKTKEEFLAQRDSKFISDIIKELVIFTNGLEEKVNSLEDFIDQIEEKSLEDKVEEVKV